MAIGLFAPAGAPYAATTTTTFPVQITIAATCVINSASILNFGAQGVLTAPVNQTSAIQVQCTNTTPYNMGLNAGTAPGATVTTRQMTNGLLTVNYALYSDAVEVDVAAAPERQGAIAIHSQFMPVYFQISRQLFPGYGLGNRNRQ